MTPLPLETTVNAAVTTAPVALPKFSTLFKNSWRWLFGDIKRLVVLIAALLLAVIASIGVELFNPAYGSTYPLTFTDFIPLLLVSCVSFIFTMVMYTLVVTAVALPVNFTWSDVWVKTKKLVWPLMVVVFALSLMVMLGLFALLIPGLALMLYLYVAPWVVVEEEMTGKQALLRSVDLVRNRFWYVGGQLLLLGLVFLPVIILAMAIAIGSAYFFLMGAGSDVSIALIIIGFTSAFIILYALPMLLSLRFMYELYRGLVVSYVPQTRPLWWQGGLFSVVYGLALGLTAVILFFILAAPWFEYQAELMLQATELGEVGTSFEYSVEETEVVY